MANKKISDLTAASALAGADLFPVVQSGVTKKATYTQLSGALASVEELVAAGVLFKGTIAAASSYPCFVAPFACTVETLALSVWDGGVSIAADDTNYWTVVLRRFRAAVSVDISTKTTKVTGGEAVSSRRPWTFDAYSFDPTNKTLAKDDIVSVAFTPTGSPTGWQTSPFTIRYVPL